MPLIFPNFEKLKARGDVERIIKLLRHKVGLLERKLVGHEVNLVRHRAVEALGELADHRAQEPLSELLKEEEDRTLRWRIALALASLDDARAVAPLVEALRSGHLRDEGKTETRAALEAMSAPEAKRALAELAQQDAAAAAEEEAAAAKALLEKAQRERVTAARARAQRLTHLLILLDGAPANEKELVEELLGTLKAADGRPYSSYISPATRIATSVVGPMDFGRTELLAVRALMWWRTKWGMEPRLDDLRFSQVSWPDLEGSTVEQWTTGEDVAAERYGERVKETAAAAELGAAGDDPICPSCGTIYNRVEVIRQLRNIVPEFEVGLWATRFKCVKCGEETRSFSSWVRVSVVC
ncbi:MAG: HEAT repeat domain-containing protein [Actinomycetota bacterium]